MDHRHSVLQARGLRLEYLTLGWNVTGVIVVSAAAITARSVALAGFGLDTAIEILASIVVVWELTGSGEGERTRRALRIIGAAFFALAAYVAVQAAVVVGFAWHPHPSGLGIGWVAATCAVMLTLAGGKAATGRALGNAVLRAEGRVTLIDAYLAASVLLGLVLNAAAGWWWADPVAGLVIVFYGVKEGRAAFDAAAEAVA